MRTLAFLGIAGLLPAVERKREGEGGAFADAARDVDPAAVILHDLLADREPEARAFSRRLRGEERLEHLREILRRYAASGVADRHERMLLAALGPDSDLAAGGAVIQ